MPSVEERYAALRWAAGFRGASDEGGALDWMVERGLVEYDFQTGLAEITAEGEKYADNVHATLADVGVARGRRRRTNLVLLGSVVCVWLWRRK